MERNNLSKHFCIAPWVHIYMDPNGSMRPCCTSDHDSSFGNSKDYTRLIDAVNSPGLKNLRKEFLEGKRPESCSRCWVHEDTSGNDLNSYRAYINGMFRDTSLDLLDRTQADGTLDEFTLKYVDFRWASTCNFACISCGPYYSSKWATELKQPIYQLPNKQYWIEELVTTRLNEIEVIYFVGGEPFLLPEHWRLLEALSKSGRAHEISLRYNSNLSTLQFEKKNALDYFPAFKDIEIVGSFDHYGAKAELIRWGTDWKEIKQNLEYIRDLNQPNLRVGINTVVTSLNILDFKDIMQYWLELYNEKLATPMTLYRAVDPPWLDPRNLPTVALEKVAEDIDGLYEQYGCLEWYRMFMTDVKNFILSDCPNDRIEKRNEFVKRMDELDQRRKTNWRLTLPELARALQA